MYPYILHHAALLVVADVWFQRPDRRHAHMRPILLPAPRCLLVPSNVSGCARTLCPPLPGCGHLLRTSPVISYKVRCDVCRGMFRNGMRGANGGQFVPDFVRRHVDLLRDIILQGHPYRGTLVSYLREGVGLHDYLLREYRGPSIDSSYVVGRFPGAVFKNHIRPAYASFVDAEVQALVDRGCVAKWADVRGPGGPSRPRLVMALSVE